MTAWTKATPGASVRNSVHRLLQAEQAQQSRPEQQEACRLRHDRTCHQYIVEITLTCARREEDNSSKRLISVENVQSPVFCTKRQAEAPQINFKRYTLPGCPAREGFIDRLLTLMPHLIEPQLWLAAGLEARSVGYGGISAVAQTIGIARDGCRPRCYVFNRFFK
jgi:hypothetical protein